MELYRELLGSFYRNLGGAPNIRIDRAQWSQPTNDVRRGRLLLLPIAWCCDIADEPYIIVPFANPGVPGSSVQVDLTVQMQFPDGGTTLAGIIDLP